MQDNDFLLGLDLERTKMKVEWGKTNYQLANRVEGDEGLNKLHWKISIYRQGEKARHPRRMLMNADRTVVATRSRFALRGCSSIMNANEQRT